MIFDIAVHGCRHPHWWDYVRQVQKTAGMRVSHVWDRNEDCLATALIETGAEKFDPSTPIAGLSAILLLSETAFHREDAPVLLKWRLPIFIEKPLGIQADDVVQLSKAIVDCGVPFHTGFFLRTVPPLAEARKLIESGQLGKVGYICIRFAHEGVRSGWLRDHWLLDPQFAGVGGFGDLAIHCADLLQWWGFSPMTAEAFFATDIMQRTQAEDFGVAIATYPGGKAVIEAGWAGGAGPMLEIEVLGSRGALRTRGEQLFFQLNESGDGTSLGRINLDAGMGLKPFLNGVSTGNWSACVTVEEALAANLVTNSFSNKQKS